MKVIVFDLGGTLMQYVGMPHSWVEFYYQGFDAIRRKFGYEVTEDEVERSIQRLTEMNPRVNYREEEYLPEEMFAKALAHWSGKLPIAECVKVFWDGLELSAELYPDTIPVLRGLKAKGYKIAALTDLPSGFPDERFRQDIAELMRHFDYYVSSAVSGVRKPNDGGLRMIAEKFGVPLAELVLVGDEEKDAGTAERAGCRFVRIDRSGERDGCIRGLEELYEMLD
ncbi:MAG: HAD family hydrolase [Lachnospiraceae bacterium]|nr:HAD family hydrolase [Lachnospiraceae bacterium]